MHVARRQHRAPRCRVNPGAAPRFAALCAMLDSDEALTPERRAALEHALAQPREVTHPQGELDLHE